MTGTVSAVRELNPLVVTGNLLAGLVVASVFAWPGRVAVDDLLEASFPLVLALAVLGLGFRRRRLDADQRRLVGRWLLLGVGGLFVVGLWFAVLRRIGVAFEPRFYVVTALSVGGVVGGTLGIHALNEREQRHHRRRAEHNYREIFEKVEDALLIYDPETTEVLRANDRVEDVWGYTSAEVRGKTVTELSADVDDLHDRIQEHVDALLAGETRQFDWLIERRDGTDSWVNVNANRVTIDGEDRLLGLIRSVDERKRREQAIEELHDATREMIRAQSKEEIAAIVVETAESVLGFPLVGVWGFDESESCLQPITVNDEATDVVGAHPTFEPGTSEAWRAFEDMEPRVYDDVRTAPDVQNPETPIRSEMLLPAGHHCLLIVGSTECDAFSAVDVALGRLLAANMQVACERVSYVDQLETRTEQMEFFNGLIRHDVMNAMTVIRSRADVLRSELSGRQQSFADTVVRWADTTIGVVQQVRNVLETLTDGADADKQVVDLETALRPEIQRLRATHPEVTFDVEIPEDVAVVANGLLDDVFGNLLNNAVDHNDAEGLEVRVTVRVDEETRNVCIRIADDGTGVADERKDDIFRRGRTGHVKDTGSGFGLYFADVMVSSFGGSVRVEDAAEFESGGAAFVVELPLASAERVVTPRTEI